MALELGPTWEVGLWESPYRLRFELNSGGPYVSMFTRSFDRARSLARAALPGREVLAIIAAYPNPRRELGAKWKGWTRGSAYDLLAEMGVPVEPTARSWKGYVWPGGSADVEAKAWVHRACRLTWDQADILLWNQVAHDTGVMPQAPVLAKLVDLERSLCVFAYDDRGMDVTALTPDAISPLREQFDQWLLDYDRVRMAEAFNRVHDDS